MAIDYCKARGLDILLKPVHLVPMQVTDARSKEKVWRDVPMPGIGMYRIQADRSGNYAGADEPVFGPDVTEEFQDPYNQSAKIKVTYPQWCKYTVYKMVNGQRVAFHALERWKENYATQSGKTECPNAMWRKRPYAQLISAPRRRRCARPGRRSVASPPPRRWRARRSSSTRSRATSHSRLPQRRAAPWMPSAARAPNRSPRT